MSQKSSGLPKGITLRKSKLDGSPRYEARIRLRGEGKIKSLGTYKFLVEAVEAYNNFVSTYQKPQKKKPGFAPGCYRRDSNGAVLALPNHTSTPQKPKPQRVPSKRNSRAVAKEAIINKELEDLKRKQDRLEMIRSLSKRFY